MKKKLVFVVIAVTVCLSGCRTKHWQTFSEQQFTVTMPGTPKEDQEVDPTDGITTYTYSVDFNKEGYSVCYNDYPAADVETMNAEEVLDGSRDRDLADLNGTLMQEGAITLAGYAGKEFDIVSIEGDEVVTYRIYWVPPRLYHLIYSRPKGAPLSADAKRFFDSFSFQKTSNGGPDVPVADPAQ